jgi:hypothetical protein
MRHAGLQFTTELGAHYWLGLVPLLGGNDMATKINRSAFFELIEQDIAWLLAQPRTLERDHIEHILKDAEGAYYGTTGPSKERASVAADVLADDAVEDDEDAWPMSGSSWTKLS